MVLEKLMNGYNKGLRVSRDTSIIITVALSYLQYVDIGDPELALQSAVFLGGLSAYIRVFEVQKKYYPKLKEKLSKLL
jgi:hypothetical protein